MPTTQEPEESDSPIFMRVVDPARPDNGTLQSEFDDIVKEAKSAGDALYKESKWLDARDAYTRGAGLYTSDPDVRKAILLNLAATNLQLENWNDVLRDTTSVLLMNKQSVKALYRSARALNELQRFEEAIDCCKRALRYEPHNKPLQDECQAARLGSMRLQQFLLLKAYKYHQMYIIPTSKIHEPFGSIPTTHPHEMPYFDPPIPSNPLTAPMLCIVRFRYVERYASDTAAELPMNKPLLPLLETFLPGAIHFPDRSRTRNNLTFVPSESGSGIQHPTDWDPCHEFLPSTVSVYARTRRGEIVSIEGDMSLSDLFDAVRRLSTGKPEDESTHIELRRGMAHLFTFRNGSEAEQKWIGGEFEDPADLGDPGK